MALITVIIQYAAIGVLVGFLFYRNELLAFLSSINRPTQPIQQAPNDSRPLQKRRAKTSTRNHPQNTLETALSPQVAPSGSERQGDDAAFARDFAQAQRGTDLTKKPDVKKRSTKQRKQSVMETSSNISGSHASTPKLEATEAIDGSSPAVHAPVIGLSNAAGMDTDYVLKMAESLRIAPDKVLVPVPHEAEWTSVPTKSQKKEKKAERAEETKKQRQRQAQKEQYRELKEEADQKQRALMEKQRRGARIARGEPARNGESYQESAAPTKSVWQISSPPKPGSDELLDTFDDSHNVTLGPVIANGDDHVSGDGKVGGTSF